MHVHMPPLRAGNAVRQYQPTDRAIDRPRCLLPLQASQEALEAELCPHSLTPLPPTVSTSAGPRQGPGPGPARRLKRQERLSSRINSMDKGTRLQEIRDHKRAQEAIESCLTDLVKAARSSGATWQEIGDSLGVTRQGAWLRYHPHLPHEFPLGPDS